MPPAFRKPACWALTLGAILALPAAARAEAVSFRNEVMAVFSRAGCNQGGCHGNQNGKGGFKLSLRGENPAFDFESLTRDQLGRRLDPNRTAASLVLLKATGAVPHEGGKRFAAGSPEYRILHHWIAAGAPADGAKTPSVRGLKVTPANQVVAEPADSVRLKVEATFSDGTVRDVTGLAVFEASGTTASVGVDGEVVRTKLGEIAVLVRYLDQRATAEIAFVPDRPSFAWKDLPEANFIDRHVFAKLKMLQIGRASCRERV